MSEVEARRRDRGRTALVALPLLALSAGFIAAFSLGDGAKRQELRAGAGLAHQVSPRLWIRVEPGSRTVVAGSAAAYHVRIHHRGDGPVWLRVTRGLPPGATASVRPPKTRGSHATLTIRTAASTPTGTYRPRLRARGGVRHANVSMRMVVAPPRSHSFEIGGTLQQPLVPGLTVPLDLTLRNRDSTEMRITDLGVDISTVTAPGADADHPCSEEDFSVAQFSGDYPFALGRDETTSLGQLGFSEDEWPQITMLDRPVNQDGCQGATLAFDYTGTSQGGTP